MSKNNVIELESREASADPLTELLRISAHQLIYQAVVAEVQDFLADYDDARLPDGRVAVVRNGYQPEREIQAGLGPVTVKIPKVRAKTGEPVTFRSALVPPYIRKTKTLEAALPWLYLKGISTRETGVALEVLVGPDAVGFSEYGVAIEASLGTGISGLAD
jgi:putative transposase